MRRVVVTGIGIVSPIGSDAETVAASLKNSTSGITFSEEQSEHGFRSHVAARPSIDIEALIDKRVRRFMGDGAAWNYIAMQNAIEDSGLAEDMVSNVRSGLVVGSGGPSVQNQMAATDIVRKNGAPKRIGPFYVPRCMSSTNSATLATPFKIKGVNYSMTSACSTSAHCIGHGAELIQFGKQDIIFAGGGEELHWSLTCLFDAMGALSSNYNETTPTTASRAYDKNRDGFVIAGGGGTIVLEEYEHAKARGAKIYGELIGYGANSDGFDMVQPSGEGAVRCMNLAMSTIGDRKVDYINTHGTSTPVGDAREMQAMRDTFGKDIPALSSTKSLTGHSLGATGVQEAIYCLLMMQHGFKAASAHIEELDPEFEDIPIVREHTETNVDVTMSNSFGFGGTNATLVFGKV